METITLTLTPTQARRLNAILGKAANENWIGATIADEIIDINTILNNAMSK